MSRISIHIRNAWFSLGRSVNLALPFHSGLTPNREQIAVAAQKVGVSQSVARTAWNVFAYEAPAPSNVPPRSNYDAGSHVYVPHPKTGLKTKGTITGFHQGAGRYGVVIDAEPYPERFYQHRHVAPIPHDA